MPLRLCLSSALALALALAVGAPLSGCSSPYEGKSERLKKPKKKKRPKDDKAQAATEEPPVEDKCNPNFFDEPTKKRNARAGRRLAGQAEGLLVDADRTDDANRKRLIVEALDKLTNALKKDPYGPEPTLRMAVAYAMAGRRSCSIKLLERLNALQGHPDVAKQAARTVKRALSEEAFEKFRKDANKALGE